ncbi:MAG: hypothetical protein K0U45_09460 [Alphaproteobacteria bacterium]|nr:hypothetical protein [Alphaproteobacteria bacterium]
MTNPYAAHQRRALATDKNQNVEAWALLELARRLDGLKKTADDKKEIMRIVRMNWQVWTVFQSALLDPENPLPAEIRSNLLNLANFIDKRSIDLLARPNIEQIDILIHINRNIGSGLMGDRGDGVPPEQLPEHMQGQPAGPQLETEESKQAYAQQTEQQNNNQPNTNESGTTGQTSIEV